MKTILVTGSAGFIGTNLVLILLKHSSECKVIGLDNYSSGTEENTKLCQKYENFQFLEGQVETFKISDKIDQIYHLACVASPPQYQADPLKTLDTCYLGTSNMLELAKKNDCPILFSSTSEIYGEPLVTPQSENYRGNTNIVGPRSCYDEGKRVAETLCYTYREMGVDVKLIRIFNTYGPHMNIKDGRVITNFIQQLAAGQEITIYGNGTQTRSFCYIDDLIKGIQLVMERGELGPYNLGNPGEISILRLVQILEGLMNKRAQLKYLDLPKDDPTRRCPDIRRARQLGWQPSTDLYDGLKRTIKYHCS